MLTTLVLDHRDLKTNAISAVLHPLHVCIFNSLHCGYHCGPAFTFLIQTGRMKLFFDLQRYAIIDEPLQRFILHMLTVVHKYMY